MRDCNVSFGISNSCLLSTSQLWEIGSDLTVLTQSQCRIARVRSTVAGPLGARPRPRLGYVFRVHCPRESLTRELTSH